MSLGSDARSSGGGARLFLVALFVALGAAVALVLSSAAIPKYRATAKVLVGLPTQDGDPLTPSEEGAAARNVVASYAQLITSRTLAERVVEEESLSIAPTDLTERLQARVVAGTRVIEVALEDTSASRAQSIVNATVAILASGEVEELEGPASVSVFERALPPARPVSPDPVRDGVVGGLVGFVLGAGVANARARRVPRRSRRARAPSPDLVSTEPPPWVPEPDQPVPGSTDGLTTDDGIGDRDIPGEVIREAESAATDDLEDVEDVTFEEALSRVKAVAEEIRASRQHPVGDEDEPAEAPSPEPPNVDEEFWEEGPRFRLGKEKEEE